MIGFIAQYTISQRDLKNAPTDPGERYVWATTQCINRVSGCTADDVSETYDKLIEQSCTAAGISVQMATLSGNLTKTKTKSTCTGEINTCIQSETKCHADFGACDADADFTKFFSECAAEITGCDEHTSAIRTELLTTRDQMICSWWR